MDNYGNVKKDEVIAAIVAACAACISSMAALYYIAEHVEDTDIAGHFKSMDEDIDLDDIEEGMEASSKQTKHRPSTHSRRPVNKACGTNIITETMSAMAANIGRIAKALDQSRNIVSTDNLYEEVMKIQGFDDEFLVEAFEYVSSDDKKVRTFFSLSENQRKIWLLKHLNNRKA